MPDPKSKNQHEHQRIQVSSRCADCGAELANHTFNRADMEQQQMTELPDREAMSLVNANLAIPINIAAALNILSDGSIAQAGALQQTPIGQAS